MLTDDDVRSLLRQAVEAAGSQRQWATVAKVSPVYVSDVLAGRKAPGSKILAALKLERVVLYRPSR
jgi:hypothetical protein